MMMMNALSIVQSAMMLADEESGALDALVSGFKKGGAGMYPIALCGIILLAILIDRFVVLFIKAKTNKAAFLRGLRHHIVSGDLNMAMSYVAAQRQTPMTKIVQAGLKNVYRGEAEVQAAMDEAALRENPKIEARTGYLAMIGNAAMLCGLLGTVSGLITCFNAVAHVSAADKGTILSEGISEAMHCTAFGLGTAIPSLVSFAILSGRTQKLIDDINEVTVSVLNLVIENKDKLMAPMGGDASAPRSEVPAFHE